MLHHHDDLSATLQCLTGHNLKTPLNAVVAAADELAAEHGESATASTLKGQARRLRRAFDDLVKMTRIEASALVVTLAHREGRDLVVLDIGPPDRDGLELMALLKAGRTQIDTSRPH